MPSHNTLSHPPSPSRDWAAHFQARDAAYHAMTAPTATRYLRVDGRFVVRYRQPEYYCCNPDAAAAEGGADGASGDEADSDSTSTTKTNTTTTNNLTTSMNSHDNTNTTDDATDPTTSLLTVLDLSAHHAFNASMRARDARNRNRHISQEQLAVLKAGRGASAFDGDAGDADGERDGGEKVQTLKLYDLRGKGGEGAGGKGEGGEGKQALIERRDSGIGRGRGRGWN